MQASFRRCCNRIRRVLVFRAWREQQNHRSWQHWTNELSRDLAKGDYDKVLGRVEKTLQKWPQNHHVLLMAIEVARCLGDRQASLYWAQQLIESHPNRGWGYASATGDLVVLGRIKEAMQMVQQGQAKVPNNPHVLEAAASVFRVAGKPKDSIQAACQRLLLKPKWLFKTSRYQFLNLKTLKEEVSLPGEYSRFSSCIDFIFNSQFILSSPDIPFNFIYAPKNACSTIKNTLLPKTESSGLIHTDTSLCLMAKIDPCKDFAVLTRHPIHRFLSAYYDKMVRLKGEESGVWRRMVRQYDFHWGQQPSIDDLLDAFLADDPNLIDPHFRPQSLIFSSDLVKPAHIFRMENLDELLAFLYRLGFPARTYSKHASKKKINAAKPELTMTTIKKLHKLYEKDFELYQYSLDSMCSKYPGTIAQEQQLDPLLETILKSQYEATDTTSTATDHVALAELLANPTLLTGDQSHATFIKIGLEYRSRKSNKSFLR